MSLCITRKSPASTWLQKLWVCRPWSTVRLSSSSLSFLPSSLSDDPCGGHTGQQVVVALSGGVDSAVATGLLLRQPEQHYAITQAIHMTNWNAHDDDSITSCMERDWRDAQAVARHYGISSLLRHESFEREYWHSVFEPYLEDLSTKGWMGSPDVDCNVHIKFGVLRDFVQKRYGRDTWLATGHYARLWRRREELEAWMETSTQYAAEDNVDWMWRWGRRQSTTLSGSSSPVAAAADGDLPLLVSAVDPSKDQSYFLSGCTSQQLSRVIFPLGHFYKTSHTLSSGDALPTVRQLAEDWHLPVAHKRDSVGICFIGKRKGGFRAFLRQYYQAAGPNEVHLIDVDTQQVVGVVDALTAQSATRGQSAKVSGAPVKYFVVGLDEQDASKIFVCAGTHHPALYADSMELAADFVWFMSEIPSPLLSQGWLRVQCRIRNLQPLANATLHRDSLTGLYSLFLDRPFRGITPGQRAVVYLGCICLGGATIKRAGPSYLERDLPLPTELHPAGANDFSVHRQQESA